MAPLIGFFVLVIDLYIWVVIASAILSWLVAFNVVNTNNRVVLVIADTLYRLTEPALRPIRSILPNLGGIDISPVILILILLFIRDVVLLGWLAPTFIQPAELVRGDASSSSVRRSRDGVILAVRLTPKSSRDEIVGIEDYGGECVLKARVRAIPEGGRANAALETLIARWLSCRRRGSASRMAASRG